MKWGEGERKILLFLFMKLSVILQLTSPLVPREAGKLRIICTIKYYLLPLYHLIFKDPPTLKHKRYHWGWGYSVHEYLVNISEGIHFVRILDRWKFCLKAECCEGLACVLYWENKGHNAFLIFSFPVSLFKEAKRDHLMTM